LSGQARGGQDVRSLRPTGGNFSNKGDFSMDDSTNAPPNFGFVKMMKTPDTVELIETSPLTFALAAVIAIRSRFMPGVSLKGLKQGECFLGDHRKCGLSMRQYRTAKQNLAKWRFATFKTTNKGTIARLIDKRLFDVLGVPCDKQADSQPTSSRQLSKTGKHEKNVLTETGVFADSNALSSSKKASSKGVPFDAEEVFEFADRNGIPMETSMRFIRFNNAKGWPLDNWRGSLLKFGECCDETNGADAVPENWMPEIISPD
jgi:hypothetical protein